MHAVNFGCGTSTAPGWANYDASPTLRLQRMPLVGALARRFITPVFPLEVRFGDVTTQLPEASASCDLVYCSHILEHLALAELRCALRETLRILKPGGVFRGVLPDLESACRNYLDDPEPSACSRFMASSHLGMESRPSGAPARLRQLFGNAAHLWMWDFKGLEAELSNAGFAEIRRAELGDSAHEAFAAIEVPQRWHDCLGFECRRPA